jgi:hypothetical protein
VVGSAADAAVLENNAAIMSVVGYFIPAHSYHFVIAAWSTKRAQSDATQVGGTMKLNPPGVISATTCYCATWFSAIFLTAFLTGSSASAAVQQTGAQEMSPEEWVLARVTEGKIADLRQFPEEKNRKLRANFLEDLLSGALPAFKPHRNGVQIRGAIIDEPIELTHAQVPCDVRLEHCRFMRSATFSRTNFTGLVSFDGSEFKGDATFSGMKVGGDAIFDAAVFEGPVYFTRAEIVGQFQAAKAQFKNFFSPIKVEGDAIFDAAVFEGPVYFTRAEIAGDFKMKEANFRGKDNQADFESMKVAGRAIFDAARFEGPVNVNFADFGSLFLSEASWGEVAAGQLHYKYIADYRNRNSTAQNEFESHKRLLEVAKSAPYVPSVYSTLEDFFLRQGYPADADEAFIEGKRHERKNLELKAKESFWEYLRSGRWFLWLGSLMLDLLVGYGRRPWQAGIPCAVLVALGCVLFSPKKMEPRNPEEAHRVYSRFWYSLGLFLPFVDLQADKVFRPKADQIFLRNYMRVHILLGWILIPIALAALTGLIK